MKMPRWWFPCCVPWWQAPILGCVACSTSKCLSGEIKDTRHRTQKMDSRSPVFILLDAIHLFSPFQQLIVKKVVSSQVQVGAWHNGDVGEQWCDWLSSRFFSFSYKYLCKFLLKVFSFSQKYLRKLSFSEFLSILFNDLLNFLYCFKF